MTAVPFYRTAITQYGFALAGAFLAYALSPWAPPPWHDTPSLRWLHSVMPYSVMAGGFALYTLLLLTHRIVATVIADFIGLAAYGTGLVAVLVTLRMDRPTNPLLIASLFLACVLHFAAGRLALIQKEAT